MGRGAEILLLPLGGMALLAVAGVFAAFFSRTAAWVCAGPAFGLEALFLLAALGLNDWSFWGLLDAIQAVPSVFAVLGGSVLMSLVAVRAPLRRPGSVGRDGRRTPDRPRWVVLVLAAMVTAAGVGYGVAEIIDGQRGGQKTRAILAGDPNARLRQVRVEFQQRRVVCTDPEVLRYLEARFRGREPEPGHLGAAYQLTLTYDGGGSQAFESYWTDTGDFVLFLGEAGEGGKGHGVRLVRPRPRGVDEGANFLLKTNRVAAGGVLILEAGGSRIERDESLVAR